MVAKTDYKVPVQLHVILSEVRNFWSLDTNHECYPDLRQLCEGIESTSYIFLSSKHITSLYACNSW